MIDTTMRTTEDLQNQEQAIQDLDLDLLPPMATYNLIKLGAKKSSSLGYPDKFTVMKICRTTILYYPDTGVHLYCQSYRDDWFVTSPIIGFDIKTLKIETLNSFYQLECIGVD